ncbi:MAG TPA: hypothetical protein VK943_08510, partial [Arenibaculum sp.]|nr:hypothetical protein [Arenibaculum sp.]
EFACSHSADRMCVIVEANVPRSMISVKSSGRAGALPGMTVKRAAGDGGTDDVLAQTRAFLAHVTGTDPRMFRTAKAFSVFVNGEQLAEIASSPLVRRVLPNRRFRAP